MAEETPRDPRCPRPPPPAPPAPMAGDPAVPDAAGRRRGRRLPARRTEAGRRRARPTRPGGDAGSCCRRAGLRPAGGTRGCVAPDLSRVAAPDAAGRQRGQRRPAHGAEATGGVRGCGFCRPSFVSVSDSAPRASDSAHVRRWRQRVSRPSTSSAATGTSPHLPYPPAGAPASCSTPAAASGAATGEPCRPPPRRPLLAARPPPASRFLSHLLRMVSDADARGWLVEFVSRWGGDRVREEGETPLWLIGSELCFCELVDRSRLTRHGGSSHLMKNEQAISEVLCWSRDPSELRRLASRKEEIHSSLRGGAFYQMRNGSREFMSTLANYKIPLAVASTWPRKVIEEAIEAVGMRSFFDAVVAAEDVYRGKPDPEMFLYAAQLLSFIPERCIVFGNSNSAVEAAHDARMKCVAVASKHKIYELSAADLVVEQLDELSVVDLKNLADIESPEFGMEPEPEMEEEDMSPPSTVGVDDISW